MQSLWKAWQFLTNQNPNQTKQKRKQATIKLSWLVNFTLPHHVFQRSEDMCSQEAWTQMFTAALFITDQMGYHLFIFQWVSEWLQELWDIHTVEYYLVITRDRLLIHATTWNNFQKKKILGEKKPTLESYICVSIYKYILKTLRVKYCRTPCWADSLFSIQPPTLS